MKNKYIYLSFFSIAIVLFIYITLNNYSKYPLISKKEANMHSFVNYDLKNLEVEDLKKLYPDGFNKLFNKKLKKTHYCIGPNSEKTHYILNKNYLYSSCFNILQDGNKELVVYITPIDSKSPDPCNNLKDFIPKKYIKNQKFNFLMYNNINNDIPLRRLAGFYEFKDKYFEFTCEQNPLDFLNTSIGNEAKKTSDYYVSGLWLSLKTKKPQNKPQPLINLKCEFDKIQFLFPNSARPDITQKHEKIQDLKPPHYQYLSIDLFRKTLYRSKTKPNKTKHLEIFFPTVDSYITEDIFIFDYKRDRELIGKTKFRISEEYKINRVSGSIIQTIEEYNPVLEFTGKQGTIKKFGICTPVEDAPSNKF